MKDDKGSLSVFGLFLTLGLMIISAVLVNSTSLYLQQRQLESLSDSLALDLADYLQVTSAAETYGIANSELTLLNSTQRDTELTEIVIEAPKVSLKLCQAADLGFLTLINQVRPIQVCAASTASLY